MLDKFWDGKRVIVTGGAGFLGSFVTEKLKLRGAQDIFIPRIENYNLIEPDGITAMYGDGAQRRGSEGCRDHSSGGQCRGHRREPRSSGRVLLR